MQKVGSRAKGVLDFFSVNQLAGSIFAPYRQISAGRVQGTLGDELRAFGDRLFSRVIGGVIRLMLIFIGLFTAGVVAVFGLVLIAAWPFLPVLPIVGIFLIQVRVG